ncbi:MAG TPA: hypothetical protein VGC06_00530 [Actinomycetes bacterium]
MRRGLAIVHPLTDEPWGCGAFFVKDSNGVVVNVASHRGDAAIADGGGGAPLARRTNAVTVGPHA